jgi:hypothetical protein
VVAGFSSLTMPSWPNSPTVSPTDLVSAMRPLSMRKTLTASHVAISPVASALAYSPLEASSVVQAAPT